jgi:hypothetical protein
MLLLLTKLSSRSRIACGVFLLLLAAPPVQYAQELASGHEYYLYPRTLPPGKISHFLGLVQANLPEDVIETDDVIRAPLFGYHIRYGLPKNFLLEGSVNTNFITFHFALGAKWGYGFDRLRLAVGYDVAYWFGHLKQFGFDTKIRGWINYPNVLVGYDFGAFSITMTGELILIMSQTEENGGIEVSSDRNHFAGGAVGVFLEQPLWKDNIFLIGVKANFTDFYYPQWSAFSTFQRKFFIPEVFVGLVL